MRKVLRVTVVTGLLLACAATFSTAARADEDVTLKGEVVDLACYLPKELKGPDHKACAAMCAKKGAPVGLLLESGDVYLLVDDHQNPDPYDAAKKLAGSNAEIKGKKVVRGGMTAVVVGEAKGL